jgi:hypothetical protein
MVMPTMVKVATGPAAPTVGVSRMIWFPFLYTGLTVVLSLGKDIFFFIIARRKLYANFRDMAVRAVVPIQITIPPPAPRPAVTPPVIPAQS